MTATLSECGRYRYTLTRTIPDVIGPTLGWLMLNPSTASATADDPTILKVIGFTRRAGYGRLIVVNLFAWRATDPKELAAMLRGWREESVQAEGPDNLSTIESVARSVPALVCAWGAQPWAKTQAKRVLDRILPETRRAQPLRLLCLGRTKDGAPLHPLMPSYDKHPLVPFRSGEEFGQVPVHRVGADRGPT